jgi:uncharacterized peroxidase-related enzyme
MPHITPTDAERPGIGGLLAYRPGPARPLLELAEILLRGPNTLSEGERELIVAYVSALNGCNWSRRAHAAFAAALLDGGQELVDQVCRDPDSAPVSEKIHALLRLAAAVTRSGKAVEADHIADVHRHGGTDKEIHDTILIAAAFCMFNRYVSGHDTVVPDDAVVFDQLTEIRVARGYLALGGIES